MRGARRPDVHRRRSGGARRRVGVDHPLFGADLLRLLGVLGHGDRAGPAPRLRAPDQLRLALQGGVVLGVLAALAHYVVHVAARLRVRPPRRESKGQRAHLCKPDRHHVAGWPLARRELELRRVGPPPRHIPRGGAAARRRAEARAGRDHGALRPPGLRLRDGADRLGLLSHRRLRRRDEVDRGDGGARAASGA